MTLAFGRWMRLLWVWWWVCLVGLLGLWFSSLHGQALAILNARRTLVLSEMSSMDERLTALRRFNETVLRSCKTRALAGPTPSFNLEQLREHAQPFANLYYCKAGRWQDPKPPDWLRTRVEQESSQFGTEIFELRPLAPGLGAGRHLKGSEARFFCLVLASAPNSYFVSQTRLDYLASEWLPLQQKRMGLGSDLRIDLGFLDPLAVTEPMSQRPGSLESLSLGELIHPTPWVWSANQLFPGDVRPVGALRWTVNNSAVLGGVFRGHLAWLLAGAAVLWGFAAALVLLQKSRQRELEQLQERERFQQMVSHDLRTPVAAITLYSEILQHDLVEQPNKREEYFRLLGGEVQQLQTLIDNFLGLGSLEKLVVDPAAPMVDLCTLVQQLCQRMAANHREPQLLEYRSEHQEILVATSTLAVSQILVNLIQNALKYGLPKGNPPGAAPVVVRVSQRPGWACLEVMDQGPGICAEEQATIFQPFVRGKIASQASGRGVGLGLAVALAMAQRIGGRLELESQQGCTFRLLLPRDDSKGVSAEAAHKLP